MKNLLIIYARAAKKAQGAKIELNFFAAIYIFCCYPIEVA